MKKINIEITRALQVGPPSSVVLVTSISKNGQPNIITLGMYMPISINPPLITIGVSSKRFSHHLIMETGEFVVNIPPKRLAKTTDLCGTISGRETDKFKETKLTSISAEKVQPPLIKECMAHLECKVVATYEIGDHTLFVGEIVHATVNSNLYKDSFDVLKAQPLLYKSGFYYGLISI